MTERTQVAKKKSATKSKKPAAGSRAASTKKATAKSARPKSVAARKKASAKKTVVKKALVKKAATRKAATKTTKKVASKKAASKKAAVKKASAGKASAKQSAAKKASARKTSTKKAVAKKSAAKASKSAATVRKAPSKKAPSKKTLPKSGAGDASGRTKKATGSDKQSAKQPAKPKKKPAPKAKDERYTLSEARAAASGLAARAGIKIVRSHTSAEPAEKTKTRRLKKSPLTKAQLEMYREILLLKRSEVASDVSAMESEAFGATDGGAFPQHQADQGSDEYEQALSLGLAETQRRLLVQIDEALTRIDEGVYGICALTGGPIGRDRLDATPWTKLSLEGAREQDRQNYYQ